MKKTAIIIMFTLISCIATAQNPAGQSSHDKVFESITEYLPENDEQADINSILEILEGYFEQPLNINRATKEQLLNLFLLDEYQVAQLLKYRETYGALQSVYELAAIDGFTPEQAKQLMPFITFEEGLEKHVQLRTNQQLIVRAYRTIEKSAGYTDGKFNGPPWKKYVRWKSTAGDNHQAGVTAETDPGEAFFKSPNRQGFDFYSFYFKTAVKEWIPTIIVGDFHFRAGMGVAMWPGFGIRKSANATQVSSPYTGLRPYTSTDENRFFRGVAATFRHKHFSFTPLMSLKKTDANITTGTGGDPVATSKGTSGLHRTMAEQEDKNNLKEQLYGGYLAFRKNSLHIGAGYYHFSCSLPIIPTPKPYNYYYFTGTRNHNLSVDYKWNLNRFMFSGEFVRSKSGGTGILQQLLLYPGNTVQMALLYRHYTKDFHSVYGNSFAERSSIINENGFYTGIQVYAVPGVKINCYLDSYTFPWLISNAGSPSSGYDFLLQTDLVLSPKLQAYIRFKHETQQKNAAGASPVRQTEDQAKQQLRLNMEWHPSENIRLKTRAEWCYLPHSKQNGILIFQDLFWQARSSRFKVWARLAFFDTSSYNTRIYAYENDLLYKYSLPAYYDKGIKGYLTLRHKFKTRLQAGVRFARLHFFNKEEVGSGTGAIPSSHKTEFSTQFIVYL